MAPERLVLSAADYAIFAITLAVSAGIGLYFQFTSKKKNNEEYLLAGKNMAIAPVAFSLMATFMSSTTLVGIPAEMYIYGTNMAFMNMGFILGPIIAVYVFLPIFFSNDVSTAYEYLEKRFGKSTRRTLSAMFAIQEVLFTSATLYAPALALSAVTNLSLWMSVVVIGVVCTFYSTLGGMKAVLWADMFQAVLMYLALIAIIIVGCLNLGGPQAIFSTANDGGRLIVPSFTLDLAKHYTFFNVLAQGIIVTASAYGGSQVQVQRMMAVKNLDKSRMATFLSIPMLVAFQLLCCFCGLIFYAYFRSCDPLTSPNPPIHRPDQLMPYFITSTMANMPGLPGLCISGIFSASLSTVSSAINSLAAVTAEDFLQPIFPNLTEKKMVFITKFTSLGYGVLCIVFSFTIASIGNLIKINVIIVGMVAGPNLGVFLLAACTKTANEVGTILGVVSSLILAACLSFIPQADTDPYLPLSTECPDTSNFTMSSMIPSTVSSLPETTILNYNLNATSSTTSPLGDPSQEGGFVLAYMWISSLALITCLVVGFFSSWIVTYIRGKPNEVPEIYLSPVRNWFSRPTLDNKDKPSTIEVNGNIEKQGIPAQIEFIDITLRCKDASKL